MLETEIKIAAPPSKVRKIMLDFPKYQEWHTTYIKLLEAEDSSKTVEDLQPGDKIKCDFDGMKFTAEIKENSESLFQWQGPPVYGLIAGCHSFHFEPVDGGSATLFRQTESFSGPISFLMSPSLVGRKILGQFKQFNQDLKAHSEKSP